MINFYSNHESFPPQMFCCIHAVIITEVESLCSCMLYSYSHVMDVEIAVVLHAVIILLYP